MLSGLLQEAGILHRLAALNSENQRLEKENNEFRESNKVLREILPQMPYISTPPAQLALPQFWHNHGHPAPHPIPAPAVANQDTDAPVACQQHPAPLDPAISHFLNKRHQEYLDSRNEIIDAREKEFKDIQQQLAGMNFTYSSRGEKPPQPEPESALYAERSHSRLEFGRWENHHREYAARWMDRPERAAAGHT